MINFLKSLIPHRQPSVSLKSAFDNHYRPIKLRTKAESTVKAYEITLRHFDRYLERTALLSDLVDKTVAAFLESRIQDKAPRTVNRDLTNLQALANWLWKRQIIPQTLTDLEPYIAQRGVPHALTMDEVDLVWSAINQTEGHIGRVPAPVFLRALFLVFWDTAERFTAVTSIRVSDVNLKTGNVFMRGETRKGRRADRNYPLSEQTVAAIDGLLAELGNIRRTSKLFFVPYSKDKLWQILGDVMVRAGLPDDARHKTHLIRRTVATHLHKNGGNATELLDHARAEITKNNYIDPRIARTEGNLDLLSRPGERRD